MDILLFALSFAVAALLVVVVRTQMVRRRAQIESMPDDQSESPVSDLAERFDVAVKAQRHYIAKASTAMAAQGRWLLAETVSSLAAMGEKVRPSVTPLEARVAAAAARAEMEAALEIYQASMNNLVLPTIQKVQEAAGQQAVVEESPSADPTTADESKPGDKLPN